MQAQGALRLPALAAQLLRQAVVPTCGHLLRPQHAPAVLAAATACAPVANNTWRSLVSTTGSAHKHASALDASGTQENHCWKCDFRVQRGGLVCKACDSIQPAMQKLSHFALLNLPEGTFDVDPEDLEKRYKSLQWKLHPDKAVGKSRLEQMYAAEHATAVNEAYSILKDPLSRANYILSQQGVLGDEQESETIVNQALLMEVMEAREQVEETNDQAELRRIQAGVQESYSQLVQQLSSAFAKGDNGAAKQLTVQLRYLARLLEEIVKKLE